MGNPVKPGDKTDFSVLRKRSFFRCGGGKLAKVSALMFLYLWKSEQSIQGD